MTPTLIVCALDRSAVAPGTLAQAMALAAWHRAELHVLHVLPRQGASVVSSFAGAIPDEAVGDDARAWLADLLAEPAPEVGEVRHVFYRGDVAAAIIAHARTHAADLVVVGRRPFRRLRRYRTSVARAVARAAVCPVLIVPADLEGARRETSPRFHEIVCAVDFSAASAIALEHALWLVQESGGRLHPVHVLDGLPNELVVTGGRAYRFLQEYGAIKAGAETRLRDAVPPHVRDWCEVRERVVGGTPSREIVKVADSVDADLIVVGVRPRGVVDEVFVGATLPALLRNAGCPVLTVPASADVTRWPATGHASADMAARGEPERVAFV